MAKGESEKQKKTTKLSKKDQYERFQKAARDLHVDDDKSAQTFERTFSKIVPPKRPVRESS